MVEGLSSLYLLVSGDCNLSCSYCYADGGGYGRPVRAMTSGTMKAALRKLLPRNGRLTVSFFGGEPMMNFDLIRETVVFGSRLGKELNTEIRFAMTTNGTVLDSDQLEFLRSHFSHIAVSLDGGRSITNHGRKFKNEDGDVYGRIVANLALLKQAGVPYALRATIPEERASEAEAAVRHLTTLGGAGWRVEPASGEKPWRRDNWRTFVEGMSRLHAESREALLAGKPMVMAGELYKAAAYRLRGKRQQYPCMAGQGMLAVSTEGDVYPCHRFVAVDSARMGNVHDDDFPGDRYCRVAEGLELNGVDERHKCRRCAVRYVCGGECPVHCMLRGDMAMPSANHCALKVKTIGETLRFLDETTATPTGRRRIENLLSGGL